MPEGARTVTCHSNITNKLTTFVYISEYPNTVMKQLAEPLGEACDADPTQLIEIITVKQADIEIAIIGLL